MSKNTKKPKAEQMKIPGTGRKDAIEAIEKQAEKYVAARDAWQEQQEEMGDEQAKLTKLLKDKGLTEYIVDSEGTKRRAYIPLEAMAKVQKVKQPKAAPNADAE